MARVSVPLFGIVEAGDVVDASDTAVPVADCATVTVVVAVAVAVADVPVPFVGEYGLPNATLNFFSQQLEPSVVPQHHSWSLVASAVPPPQSKIFAKSVRSASTVVKRDLNDKTLHSGEIERKGGRRQTERLRPRGNVPAKLHSCAQLDEDHVESVQPPR